MKKMIMAILASIVTVASICMLYEVNGKAFCIIVIAYAFLGLCAYKYIEDEDPIVRRMLEVVYAIPAIALLLRTTPGLFYTIMNITSLVSVVILSWIMAVTCSSKKSDS